MKIEIVRTPKSQEMVVQMTMGGKKLAWSVREAKETRRNAGEEDDIAKDVFYYLNGYLESMSLSVRGKVFDLYSKIKNAIDEVETLSGLDKEITTLITNLMSLFKLDDIEHWLMHNSDITIPVGLPEAYARGVIQGSADKTYTRRDYIKLVAYVVGVRAMVPVWGDYSKQVKNAVGDNFVDKHAFELLENTEYLNCEAYDRVIQYISAFIPEDDNLASAVLDRIGREDFPKWVAATTIIRKLSMSDVRGWSNVARANSNPVLLASLHKSVSGRINHYDSSFLGKIRNAEESRAATNKGNDDNTSLLEGFKERPRNSDGEIAEKMVFWQGVMDYVFDKNARVPFCLIKPIVGDVVPHEQSSLMKFAEIFKRYKNLEEGRMGVMKTYGHSGIYIIHDWQTAIANLVLYSQGTERVYMYARTLDDVDRTVGFDAMIMACSWLWVNGFRDIAVLLSCYEKHETTDLFGGMQFQPVSMKTMEQLDITYPYKLMHRESGPKGKSQPVAVNPGLQAIDAIIKEMTTYRLYSHMSMRELVSVFPERAEQSSTEEVELPYNLRERLAQLAIKCLN